MEEKIYHSISEVADMVGVQPYVLRYWEKEFPLIRPKKNSAGSRMYQAKDIELLLLIKHLLYEKGFTIEGARNQLRRQAGTGGAEKQDTSDMAAVLLTEIKTELEELLKLFP